MTRYVPIVVVVPQTAAVQLTAWVDRCGADGQAEGFAELLDRTGWTPEMLLGGGLLVEGLAAATARPFG